MTKLNLAVFWAATLGVVALVLLIGLGLNALFPIVGRWLGACFFIGGLAIPAWFLVLHIHDSLESTKPCDT